jgi:glyoxylase-like metal-dependent hydrolase (beta-lactamase superfamily II)
MRIARAAVPPFYKNGFLVSSEDTADAVLIDPGDEVDELLAAAAHTGVQVRGILLTHAHLDHVTGVGRAKAALQTSVWLHREDVFLYDALVEQGRMFGLDLQPQPKVDHFFEPGVPFYFGAEVVEVLHTPGHCPGGVCLAIGRAGTGARELFVGDTLFAGSIGRTDLPGGDFDTLMRSIRDVLLKFPDDTPVHPGHGRDTTIGEERATNPFLNQP